MNEFKHLFIELKPPGGGLDRLRKALEDRHRRPTRDWRFAAGAVAASIFAMAWLLPDMVTRHRQTEQLKQRLQETVAPSDRGLHVSNGAAFELPSSQPNVRIFLVESMPVSTP